MRLFRRNRCDHAMRTLTIVCELPGEGPPPTNLLRGDTLEVTDRKNGEPLFSMKFDGRALVFRQRCMLATLSDKDALLYASHRAKERRPR